MDKKESPQKNARLEREAEALRENLAKRKQQQRARQTTIPETPKKESAHVRHA